MATLDELSAALVKADAAGNVDDARVFAAEIRKMRSAPVAAPERDGVAQGMGNLAAGAVRGAGSIGATLLAPVDIARDAIEGRGLSLQSNRERRSAMDAGLETLGAQPNSLLYRTGKLAGEVAGTAGAGGVVANGARALGASAPVAQAIASGGFSGGGNMLTRAAGGAINGGATAALVNPEEVGTGIAVGGALPGVVKAAGAAGNALANLSEAAAKRLMQSAIKPTIAQLRTGEAAQAVETLLQYGISPTQAGVNKLKGLIDDLNNQIKQKIGSSTATVDRGAVLNRLDDVRQRFTNQVSPGSDLRAIEGVADDFLMHPSIPVPQTQIPVQQAQEMKQGTYRVLSKKFGEAGSAQTEAQKGLARGLKEEISAAVPGVQALNAEESRLLTTLGVAERRALMELNKNPVGLTALASNPVAAAGFLADRSAAFKALAARMINASTPAAGVAGQRLIGAARNPLLRATGIVATEANP